MASVASLREHLVEELNDLLNAKHQLIEALPQMQKKASRRELKAAFRSHLAETRGQARRIEQALKLLTEKPSEKTCEAMKGWNEAADKKLTVIAVGGISAQAATDRPARAEPGRDLARRPRPPRNIRRISRRVGSDRAVKVRLKADATYV